MSVRDMAIHAMCLLNDGVGAETALDMVGFDTCQSGRGPEVFTEHECLSFADSDLIDCGWDHDVSVTIRRQHSGEWAVYERRRVAP